MNAIHHTCSTTTINEDFSYHSHIQLHMKTEKHQKYYWGIGIENETYMQFEDGIQVSGEFIHEKIGCERYSIDYRKCYKAGILAQIIQAGFEPNQTFHVSRMINSHSLEKVDVNYQHKTLPEPPKTVVEFMQLNNIL